MKTIKYFTLLLFGIIYSNLNAQTTELLKVSYENREEVDPKFITMNGVPEHKIEQEQIEFAEEIANEIYDYQLTTNENESIFEFIPKIDNNQDGIIMSNSEDGEVLYKNLNEYISLETRSVPKKFLLKDTLKDYNWKFTEESKEICGYKANKGISEIGDSIKIEAWYSPEIKIKNGPSFYQGLPGLILEIAETSNTKSEGLNKQFFKCVAVERSNSKNTIKRPNKGKVVSSQEYQIIWNKYKESYRENYNQGVDTSD